MGYMSVCCMYVCVHAFVCNMCMCRQRSNVSCTSYSGRNDGKKKNNWNPCGSQSSVAGILRKVNVFQFKEF